MKHKTRLQENFDFRGFIVTLMHNVQKSVRHTLVTNVHPANAGRFLKCV